MVKVKRFTATWCGPCKQLAPVFEQLQIRLSELAIFETIDVDVSKDEALKYEVRSVPTVIIEKDGQIIHRFIGVKPAPVYLDAIKSLI